MAKIEQLISKDNSFLITAGASINGQVIHSTGNSVMALLNSTRNTEPKADLASVIFELNLPNVEGEVNSLIPIKGTARMILGPVSLFSFDGCQVKYTYPIDNNNWFPIGQKQTTPVLFGNFADWFYQI